MEDVESRFLHLLQPIRDLTKNWEVDVAAQLGEYLEEVRGAPCPRAAGGCGRAAAARGASVPARGRCPPPGTATELLLAPEQCSGVVTGLCGWTCRGGRSSVVAQPSLLGVP